ncbi:hypothetical protein HZA45_03380 [Candidatus Peregrinibacteria bacterium]|nr:hypothetical protein [Candidatus Peregrinibacteria bacterium]
MKPKSWPLDADTHVWLLNKDDKAKLEAAYGEYMARQREESKAAWDTSGVTLEKLAAKVKYGITVTILSAVGLAGGIGAADASGIFHSTHPVKLANAGGEPQTRAGPAQ